MLVIFVVDASGSMALNRMASAKGAAMGLLKEAYKCRDKICMIAFRGSQAEVVVPPTRSLALTKNRLEAMPCGGNSPLAHALMTALRVGESAIKVKRDVSRAIVVLLTDGRANIPICVSMKDSEIPKSAIDKEKGGFSREYLNEEAIAVAEAIGESMDIDFLCIDTEDRFVGTGISEQLCRAACGTYHKLGAASLSNSVEVSQIARKKLQETRNG